MPSVKTEIFEMDRRQMLKLTGTMGVGAAFVNPAELFAADVCDKISVENGKVDAQSAGATLQFWIDGLHFAGRTDLASRANITLFMDLTQSAVSYVESVVLMDVNKRTMGARYFDASSKMTDGHVPYVRFENIQLDPTSKYFCVYTVRNGSSVKLYSATIDKPEVSRLNTTWLPQKMRDDFTTFLKGNVTNPTPGLITTQFQFYTLNGLAAHTARGRVKTLNADGSFAINIDYMHGDAAPEHYMRYFIVMDPVGRLLGFHKRQPPGSAGYDNIPSGSLDVVRIDDALKADYSIPNLQIANIADCPYIQFYTEDSYDAIARNIIRLR